MANEEELKLDDFNLDDDLNFDFSADDVSSKVNPDVKSGKRKAVEDAFKGSISGAKSALTDRNTIRDFVIKSLPKEYGEILDTADNAASDLSSLYDESIKNLKPKLNILSTKIKRIVPEKHDKVKKLLSDIQDVTETRTGNKASVSKEAVEDKSIQLALSEVFADKEKTSAKEKLLKDAVEHKKFQVTSDQLGSVGKGIDELVQYTTNITQAFQKKSLELQYRSYFVQSELLKTSNRYFEIFNVQNNSIVRNTALPENVKIQNSELFKQKSKERLVTSLQDSVFGEGSLVSNVLSNLKNKGKELTEGIGEGLGAVIDGLEASETASEIDSMLGGSKKSAANKLGAFLSEQLVGDRLNKASSKIRSNISDESSVSKAGFDILRYLKDPELLKESLTGSSYIKDAEFGTFREKFGNVLIDSISGNKSNLSGKSVSGSDDLSAPGIYTGKTNRSITEVIPGYLSRILREISILRTGNTNTPLITYDSGASKFSSVRSLAGKLESQLKGKIGTSTFNKETDGLLKVLLGDDKLTDVDRTEAKKVLTDILLKGNSSSPERLIKDLNASNSPIAGKLSHGVTSNVINSKNDSKAKRDLTNSILSTRGSMPKLNGIIDTYIEDGHIDILRDSGLITTNSDGSYEINSNKYQELLSDGGLNKLNAKQASSDSSIFSASQGRNYSESFSSTVNIPDNLVAINKEISLNTAHLPVIESDSTLMRKDLASILDILKTRSFGSSNGEGVVDGKSTDKNSSFFNNVKSKVESGFKNAKSASNLLTAGMFGVKGMMVSKLLPKIFSSKSGIGMISDLTKNTLGLAGGLLSKVTSFTGEIAGGANSVLGKGISLGKDLFNKVTEYAGDIYAEGMSEPALKANLIKIGYYVDQLTGETIKSIKDIKGPVVDIRGNVVLTVSDLSGGLLDSTGSKIKLPYEKIVSFFKNAFTGGVNRLKGLGSILKDRFSSAKETLSGKFGGGFGGERNTDTIASSDKVYNVLIEIRDILKVNYAAETGNAYIDVPGKNDYGANIKNIFKKAKKKIFNDKDDDGKRDGGAAEQFEKEEAREADRNKGRGKASFAARYRSGNVIDGMISGVGSLISKAGDAFESLAEGKSAKDILGSIKKGGGSKAAKVVGKAKSALSFLKTAGSAALALAPAAGGLLTSAGAAAGSMLATAGAATGAALSTLGTATAGVLTAGASAISAPVVLGVVAVGAIGYGAYKGYKYYTRDNITDLDAVRLSQYGLTLTDADKHHNHELLLLEEYLLDNNISYKNDIPSLEKGAVDTSELLNIFSIDAENVELSNNFFSWFKNRFKPFFLTHVKALYNVNKKLTLHELDSLTDTERSKYISGSSFESGPYSYPVSPFKDTDELTNTRTITVSKIAVAMGEVRTKLTSKFSKKDVVSSVEAGIAASRVSANTSSKDFLNKLDNDTNKKVASKSAIKPKKVNKVFTGEEINSKDTPNTATTAGNSTGFNRVPLAGGELKSGDLGFNYIKANSSVDFSGVNENLLNNFKAMAEEYGELTGKSIQVNSAYRSSAKQAMLYRQNPRKAAKPGRSLHEFGLAMDINTVDADALDKAGLMRKYGFTRPVGGETWHTEPAGIQPYIQEAKTNPKFADELIEGSIGKGGGGVGSIRGSAKHRRDAKYALSLLGSNAGKAVKSETKGKSNVIDINTRKPVVKQTAFSVLASKSKINTLPDVELKPKTQAVKATQPKDLVVSPTAGNKVKPTLVQQPNKIVRDSGQDFSLDQTNKTVSEISNTLTETLIVHRDILNAIREVVLNTKVKNAPPVNIEQEAPIRPTNTVQDTTPALSLKRKKY